MNYKWDMFLVTTGDHAPFDVSAKRKGDGAYDAKPKVRTVFKNPRIEVLAVDQGDPRTLEGRLVTERSLLEMHRHLDLSSSRLIAALIPNKALVYRSIIDTESSDLPETYFRQVEQERKLRRDLIEFLRREKIRFVDVTPHLRRLIDKNIRPDAYYKSSNEHPNVHGYRATAEAIATVLKDSPHRTSDVDLMNSL